MKNEKDDENGMENGCSVHIYLLSYALGITTASNNHCI